MGVQVFISGLILDPGCDVGANSPITSELIVDWAITNKVMIYFFILISKASGVDLEYFVRLVITLLIRICFAQLCTLFGKLKNHIY